MKTAVETYREQKERLLGQVIETLSHDDRFLAGWLTGSHGREAADALSDLDLSLVVSTRYSEKLCRGLGQPVAGTSPEHYALFSQFGTPALIHENSRNAPKGGTFTFVMYSSSALMVDWTLIPQEKAMRPGRSRLLFDKLDIPVALPVEAEELEQSKTALAETWAFFWMMAAIVLKYILRGDVVFAVQWIEHLSRMMQEVDRRLNREPWHYRPGSISTLQAERDGQLKSLRELCDEMQARKERVAEFIGAEPLTPTKEIQTLFQFAQTSNL